VGNHFFGGDDEEPGVRRAGVVFTSTSPNSILTGNYIDNSFIEMSNEHDAEPDFDNEFSFGGLTVTGNIFVCVRTLPSFAWIVVSPKGTGHFVAHLSVTGNTFRRIGGSIDRVDAVDDTVAGLNYTRFLNVTFANNVFAGVSQLTQSPVTIVHDQNTESATWVVDAKDFLPFASRTRNVVSVVPEGAVTNTANAAQYVQPYALPEQGTGSRLAHLRWPTAVKGQVLVTVRCDNPN
jgi:hypothetical protein